MDDLIKTFDIDWKLLIAQIINFTIVVLVLGVFALKPLIKLMKEREEKIAGGIKHAEEMEEKVKEIAKLKEEEIKAGRKDGQVIIAQAEKSAEDLRQEKIQKTIKEIEKMAVDARGRIREERDEMIKSVKDELGALISTALNRVSGQVIAEKTHTQLIDDVIKDLEKESLKK
ncbi:MAG: ATP synthase subunit b [Parcubacteria group bacterium GW2011_GWC2_38_7]|nr:MAG: ATP synthase subunit b [Parcubacteria group bacterium GW2011_GWC2_38_7]